MKLCTFHLLDKWSTEMRYILCTWLGEISSCSCLTVLPGPAWVLLNKICKDSVSSLYSGTAGVLGAVTDKQFLRINKTSIFCKSTIHKHRCQKECGKYRWWRIYFFLTTDISISFTQNVTNKRLLFSWCGNYFTCFSMILLWQTVYILLTWQKIYFLFMKDWLCIYVWLILMDFMTFGKFLVEVLFEERAPICVMTCAKNKFV